MKKLHFLALSILLSTGFIVEARQQQNGQQSSRSEQGGKRGQRGQDQRGQGQMKMMSKKEIEEILGGSISFESVSNCAREYADGINTLSESSQPEEIRPVMDKGRAINEALRQLLPKPEEGSMQQNGSMQDNQSADDDNSRSNGPMRRRMSPEKLGRSPEDLARLNHSNKISNALKSGDPYTIIESM